MFQMLSLIRPRFASHARILSMLLFTGVILFLTSKGLYDFSGSIYVRLFTVLTKELAGGVLVYAAPAPNPVEQLVMP